MKFNNSLFLLALIALLCEHGSGGGSNITANYHRRYYYNNTLGGNRTSNRSRQFKGFVTQQQPKVRTSQYQCLYTEKLYNELRVDMKADDKNGVKKCAVPGCFFIYPPSDQPAFIPKRYIVSQGTDEKDKPLQGCRSDIPYLIKRAESTKDAMLKELLHYLRACFVGNVKRNEQSPKTIKQCQREWGLNGTTTTDKPNYKETMLEQILRLTQLQCFYPFHNEEIFYVSFGGRSEGRVICCSDGKMDEGGSSGGTKHEDEFRSKCKIMTEYIYNAYDARSKKGWRNGKDWQNDEGQEQ